MSHEVLYHRLVFLSLIHYQSTFPSVKAVSKIITVVKNDRGQEKRKRERKKE